MGFATEAALAATAFICLGSIGAAIYAWVTHFHRQSTGAYEMNSFPMGAFARDATWFATYVCLAAAPGWWVARRRRRARSPTQSVQHGN